MSTRVALITGASSGIGRACATHLAARGVRVYSTTPAAATAPTGTMLQMDLTDDASVRRGIDTIFQREGRLDIVVNNAGIAIAGPLELTSVEEVKQQTVEPVRRVPGLPGRAADHAQPGQWVHREDRLLAA